MVLRVGAQAWGPSLGLVEKDRHTYIQTDRQAGRQTNRQTVRKNERNNAHKK